jgi:hypothetical protein
MNNVFDDDNNGAAAAAAAAAPAAGGHRAGDGQNADNAQQTAEVHAMLRAQEKQSAALQSLLATSIQVQQRERQEMQQRERSDHAAKAKQAEETARKEAARDAAQTARALKTAVYKETAPGWVAIMGVADDSDRSMLSKAHLEAFAVMEDIGADREEANNVLTAALSKAKSLNKDQQEELFKQIKIKKRATADAQGDKGGQCTRCHRMHPTSECYATTMSDNVTAAPGVPPAQRGKMQRTSGGGGGRGYGNNQPYGYPFPQGTYGQMQGAAAQFFAPPMGHMQAPPMQPMQPPSQWPAADKRTCWNCGAHGHSKMTCPLPENPAAQQMRMAAGRGMGAMAPVSAWLQQTQWTSSAPMRSVPTRPAGTATGMRSAPTRPAADSSSVPTRPADSSAPTRPACAAATAHEASFPAVCATGGAPAIRASDRLAVALAKAVSQKAAQECSTVASTSSEMATDRGQSEQPAEAAEGAGETHREEDSMASMYAARSASIEPVQWATKREQHTAALDPDSSTPERSEEAEELVAALLSTGMPDKDTSLRRAIYAHFAGRKKVLHEGVSVQQVCSRCGKRGHTGGGCPDQTQPAASDRTKADAWVRGVMTAGRVRIADVNRGLSLQEGVRLWLERGAVMNEDNPWAGSTKREDSLRRFLGYHQAMGMSAVHLGWIGFGVPLNFIPEKEPEVLAFRNHKSAQEEEAFVDAEHAAGLLDGSFVQVKRRMLKGICPLQVEKHPTSGKRRLCQDLRWINGHLPNVEFRMESLNVELGDVMQPGDKLFTTDIDKAYYCLSVHPDARPFLGWQWKGKYYMPTCLVFGLSTAPRIFTKIMRPMMAFMRSLGVRVLGMIDDYMWAAKPEHIGQVKQAVQTVLPQLGWKLNAKCVWEPADEVLMLGMLINTKEFIVKAPAKKVEAAAQAIRKVLDLRHGPFPPSLKHMQRIAGLLMSMMLALPAVRVFTRALYRAIAVTQERMELERVLLGVRSPVGVVRLSPEVIEELELWLQRLYTHNGLAIRSRENEVEVLLWSDASDVGWGGEAAGVVRDHSGSHHATASAAEAEALTCGALPLHEIGHSSTRRELVGLLQLVQTPAILRAIQGRHIRVLMDSLPALRNLINGGGPKENLTAAVKDWTRFCESHHIQPVYDWIPRAANWRADKASKMFHQQHTFRSADIEERVRSQLAAVVGDRAVRSLRNHWLGRVPMFLPMFHQVDARVEMVRCQLDEAIVVVPDWPAGAANDWYRRVVAHSIGQVSVGRSHEVFTLLTGTGHSEPLSAYWLMGRRGEKRQREEAEAAAGL